MIRKTYSVFDSKAKAYLSPFYSTTEGVATRMFSAAVEDAAHDFHKFAEDYTLFYLGDFDEETGKFTQPATPDPVITASALIWKEPTHG